MCVAGGSAYYMEPPAAVALNNERGAARSQVITAEENVLWRLTGLIIDSAPSLQHALEMVRYLLLVLVSFGSDVPRTAWTNADHLAPNLQHTLNVKGHPAIPCFCC